VSGGPDFRELVGDDVPTEERARLRRAHDLLIAAGPPPELTPALESPPETGGRVMAFPRRGMGRATMLAAALATVAFVAGFALGGQGGDIATTTTFKPVRTVVLGESGNAVAEVRLGRRNEAGNYPMLVTVEGLERQTGGDYYSLFMVKDGEPTALCGTFNVAGEERTSVWLNVAYDFEGYDGLLLAEYRASDHKDHPLLRARL
jgi:hypothetical protein